jgi:hypothetical protein
VQVLRLGGALVTGLLTLALPAAAAAAQEQGGELIATAVCSSGAGLPATIRLPPEIHKRIDTMLQRSPTFRQQCRRLAETPWLHVLVRMSVELDGGSVRARSTIKRPQPRMLLAWVDLSPSSDPALWLSHEFEHLLEQIDGIDVLKLLDNPLHAWTVRGGMFETRRAIRAGQAVAEEVHAKRQHDKFVE